MPGQHRLVATTDVRYANGARPLASELVQYSPVNGDKPRQCLIRRKLNVEEPVH